MYRRGIKIGLFPVYSTPCFRFPSSLFKKPPPSPRGDESGISLCRLLFGELKRGVHKTAEQSLRTVRTGGEFGMELNGQEPRMIRQLDHFHKPSVRGSSGNAQSGFFNRLAVLVVELVPMAVALVDKLVIVRLRGQRAFRQLAWIEAKPHRAAHILDVLLLGEQIDDRIRRRRVDLGAVGSLHADDVPGIFDDGNLHAETDAEERNALLARITDRRDLAFDSPVPEAAGHQNAVHALQRFSRIAVRQLLGVHPADAYFGIGLDAGMGKGLHDAEVGVVQSDVFADNGDLRLALEVFHAVDERFPLGHLRLRHIKLQMIDDVLVQTLLLEHQRNLVQRRGIAAFNDGVGIDVAEQGDFALHFLGDGFLRTADDDVRLNADAAQLFDAMLRRLCLHFAGSLDIRNEGDMHIHDVVAADIALDLADGLQERKALDIPDRAADFRDDDIGAGFTSRAEHALLDLVGDMGDDLDRASEIFAAAFLRNDGGVDLAGRDVAVLGQVDIDETLVMAQIQIRFRAVVRDEYFPVLVRAHRSRIHVDVGVEFLNRYLKAPVLEQSSKRCRGNPFAQG
ncbi:Uncharacterized protein BN871_BO_00110 [Paenibacillus sp. P22]|nr:Uncharacterized protein BN871_BO_00110 [Paenibacillus sp. P22]